MITPRLMAITSLANSIRRCRAPVDGLSSERYVDRRAAAVDSVSEVMVLPRGHAQVQSAVVHSATRVRVGSILVTARCPRNRPFGRMSRTSRSSVPSGDNTDACLTFAGHLASRSLDATRHDALMCVPACDLSGWRLLS